MTYMRKSPELISIAEHPLISIGVPETTLYSQPEISRKNLYAISKSESCKTSLLGNTQDSYRHDQIRHISVNTQSYDPSHSYEKPDSHP